MSKPGVHKALGSSLSTEQNRNKTKSQSVILAFRKLTQEIAPSPRLAWATERDSAFNKINNKKNANTALHIRLFMTFPWFSEKTVIPSSDFSS